MKSFIALTLVALIAGVLADPINLSDEQKAKIKLYGEECIKQEKISEEEVLKIRNRDFASPSDNLKCFANCFFEKTGTLKDGVVQEAVVLEKLGAVFGEEKTKAIMTKCNGLKGESKCETAFKLYECYENEKAKLTA